MPRNKAVTKTINIFADGGSRGNPGPSAIGVVLYGDGGKIDEVSRYIGVATNNVAEYMAAIFGLQESLFRGAKNIVLNLDSELVAKQLRGEYRVKDHSIQKFFYIAMNLIKGFDKVTIKEIPREENGEADGLVNQALNLSSLV